jgi:hypothetical protein
MYALNYIYMYIYISSEPLRLVKDYFKINQLDIGLTDTVLLQYLSLLGTTNRDSHSNRGNEVISFSKDYLIEILHTLDLKVQTWFPMSFINPYGNIYIYIIICINIYIISIY